MFDTMTATKIVASFCGALLIFKMGSWAAESLYHVGGHGHGDDHQAGYVIDTGEEDVQEDVVEVAFADVYATADADAGKSVWNKCRACHVLEPGANGAGPYLHGVVNRQVAAAEGFNYSGALSAAVDVWTPEALNGFLENPRGYAPGTSMGFNGLPKIEDRANLIAYIATFAD